MHWELIGTLKITTVVIRGESERNVTLATIHGVERVECENHLQQFREDNPHLRTAMLYAEWTVKERFHSIRREA